jgi:S1 RNA binding domain protein
MSLAVGSVVEGTVTGITNFGAFVELPSGQTGLVHISEVADVYVNDINDFIKKQDKVKVKILSVDPNGKKIGLSIRQAQEGASAARPLPPRGPRPGGGGRRPMPGSFEDKLKRFMKDSEDRLGDLRRNTEGKRGGRGSRGF